eukprot:CAMPEP_0194759064 /NCGR_PEP_ID=MMETSP0323_2-20130528/12189_1 /TAXON_ID=2866 ORGANISM="Crypthecodinium cohnii, Strain Seligo" /NCGR_SAMPLE_ID=MMETSP0323_2 /ASSEMBLY_ACC=CAM_ASM_000346 /LENGTH=80 /DNA_ID=CAMNT_0039679607 /DNA_START=428 /DNA_END=670 /DNA_ORIENTATION=-
MAEPSTLVPSMCFLSPSSCSTGRYLVTKAFKTETSMEARDLRLQYHFANISVVWSMMGPITLTIGGWGKIFGMQVSMPTM